MNNICKSIAVIENENKGVLVVDICIIIDEAFEHKAVLFQCTRFLFLV